MKNPAHCAGFFPKGEEYMKLVLLTALGVGGATVLGAVLGFLFRNLSRKQILKYDSFHST